MQRVAIARALVNNPDIILADEPTGALDSATSVQVMEILREISKTKLVVMVTHNSDLAKKYSNRIINMLDGEIISDSNPPWQNREGAAEKKTKALRHTSMSFVTASLLSFKNLMTKKGRTFITAFAGSIGIIGIALVLAISTGLSGYIETLQSDTLSGFPITVSKTAMVNRAFEVQGRQGEEYPSANVVYRYDRNANTRQHVNPLTMEYFSYVEGMKSAIPEALNAISYTRAVEMNVLAKGEDTVVKFGTSSSGGGLASMFGGNSYWQEMPDSPDFILGLYDLLGEGSRLPSAKNEIAIVVDEYNRIDKDFFKALGFYTETDSYDISDLIGKSILKVVNNDSYYTKTESGLFVAANSTDYEELYNSAEGITLTITGILRIKESASVAIGYLNDGIVYTTALTDYVLENAHSSAIASAQSESDKNIITGIPFANDSEKTDAQRALGYDITPVGVSIYPKNLEGKKQITEYLDKYNDGKSEENQVIYSDLAETISTMTGTLINTISYVLIAFAAISLVVSTIMIAIIIYVSVLERTKEIGILRSVGARKKDISRVFNAEAIIIGLIAGLMGVGFTYLLSIPINIFINSLVGIENIANLKLIYAVILVIGSMLLTTLAGFIPSKIAAKKDPVVALRTE